MAKEKKPNGANLGFEEKLGLGADKVFDFIEQIPIGFLTNSNARFLYEISRETKGIGEIVEIGTFGGKSVIALAFGQKEKNGKVVHSIDMHEHIKVHENLNESGVGDFVKRYIGRSAQIAKTWNQPIELLWIDGAHNFTSVARDIRSWIPHIVIGGWVIFHDYPGLGGAYPDAVHKAVYKFLLNKPRQWRVISDRDCYGIMALQKLSTEGQELNLWQGLINGIFDDLKDCIHEFFYNKLFYKKVLDFYIKIKKDNPFYLWTK